MLDDELQLDFALGSAVEIPTLRDCEVIFFNRLPHSARNDGLKQKARPAGERPKK